MCCPFHDQEGAPQEANGEGEEVGVTLGPELKSMRESQAKLRVVTTSPSASWSKCCPMPDPGGCTHKRAWMTVISRRPSRSSMKRRRMNGAETCRGNRGLGWGVLCLNIRANCLESRFVPGWGSQISLHRGVRSSSTAKEPYSAMNRRLSGT